MIYVTMVMIWDVKYYVLLGGENLVQGGGADFRSEYFQPFRDDASVT